MKTLKFTLIITLFLLTSNSVFSQGAAINTTGAAADASAAFEVSSTTGGTLITRMTTAERNAIVNPAEALQIYNTTTKCLEIFINPMWQSIYCACNPPASPLAGSNTPTATEIVWNWNSVNGATGYKYNSVNDYSSATDNGNTLSYTQSGLICNTSYTLYVWAYSTCGNSSVTTLNQTTSSCFTCGIDNLVDSRDAQSYQTLQLGSQCWMKENLKYLPMVHSNIEFATQGNNSLPGYGVYGYDGSDVTTAKSQSNYATYGVLYNWFAAMAGSLSSSTNPSGVQGVCPSGWHLPSDAEWKQLEMHLGMSQAQADITGWRGTDEGSKLKSTFGWNSGGNGTDAVNFTALPGGGRSTGGSFSGIGDMAHFWVTTQSGSDSWCRMLYHNNVAVYRALYQARYGSAVRCIRD